jgi:hypothetical protein
MSGFIEINGEQIPVAECNAILKRLFNTAKDIAGEFHNMERSEKFRLNWPDEDQFAESEWKNFVEAAIQLYVAKLVDPLTPDRDKRELHLAILLNAKLGENQETDARLQIMPNTQQFVGDKYENKQIIEKFGKKQNYRAQLKRTAADMQKAATRH